MVGFSTRHRSIDMQGIEAAISDRTSRYKKLYGVGSGKFGEVFKFDDRLNGPLAVKLYHQQIPDIANKLRRGIEIVDKIDHTAVAAIYATGKCTPRGISRLWRSERNFLVMEYLLGENLEEQLERKGKFSIEDATKLLKQSAAGLRELHRKGVLHGDVKTKNIMNVEERGAVLVDFDFLVEIGNRPTLITGGFASPEGLRGQIITQRSDIYSLGVTVFRIITGRDPYYNEYLDGPHPLETGSKISIKKQILEKLGITEKLKRTLLKMLESNPEKRFQSMDEVLEVL